MPAPVKKGKTADVPRRACVLALTTVALAALVAPVAHAAPAAPERAKPAGKAKWSTLASTGISTITEPGLFRTADGTLHVAITTQVPPADNAIEVAHVAANGSVIGTPTPAVGTWAAATFDPDLVGAPGGGMRLVFGGVRTRTTGDPYSEGYLYSASADASGSAWTLAPNTTPVVKETGGYASYGTGVTTLPDGTLVAAYPINSGVSYQVGQNAPQGFTVPACCVYDMSLVQENGVVWAAYYANGSAAADQGVFVRQLYPTLGPAIQAPGSVSGGSSLAADQAVAMVARPGGGVYVAYKRGYPTTTSVAVWKVGDAAARAVPDSAGADFVDLSTTPDGRLWVGFDGDRTSAQAVRSNQAATKFGAVQSAKMPKGTTIYGLKINGGTGRGDVVVNTGTSILHTQLLSGLTVKASPKSLKAGKPGELRVKVTDAGEAVKGATVKAKGEKCKTDKKGRCTIKLPKLGKGAVNVLATAGGYNAGSDRVRVR
jgi:hypothetical protein